MTLTFPQTVVLLALSRGEEPPYFPPITRRALLRAQYIEPDGDPPPPTDRPRVRYRRRRYVITAAGLAALQASPHRADAERSLARPESRCAP